MDNNGGSPSQGEEPPMKTEDWRSQLPADSRERIVNKILDTLERHLPYSGEEGSHELKKIALRLEEKIHAYATCQSDYLRKISLKMLTMESRPQNTVGSFLSSNSNGAQMNMLNPSSYMQPAMITLQQLQQSNPLMQQSLQARGQVSGSMLQSPNAMEEQRHIYQSILLQKTSSTSLDSTAQTGYTNCADWQEVVYQKIQVMKEMYYLHLIEIYETLAAKLHQIDSLPQVLKLKELEKVRMFKAMMEHLITILQISKSNISTRLKENLGVYENQIVNLLNMSRLRNPASSLQSGPLPIVHMQSMEHAPFEVTEMESILNEMNQQLQSLNL